MKKQISFALFVLIFIPQLQCSFWNEIPVRCIYDQTALFSCWNTTFMQPIPLFNDLKYTLQNHRVEIDDSSIQLSLKELFVHVAPNIEQLSLTNNTFPWQILNKTDELYFRLLRIALIHDQQGSQWSQLKNSYFPQLIQLDLSYNQLTDRERLIFNQKNFPNLKVLNLSNNQLSSIANLTGDVLNRIESLVLSFNPLESLLDRLKEFRSLQYLDLSATSIKQLFSLTFFPRLQIFLCRQCRHISVNEYDRFLSNCSQVSSQLKLDWTETNINSLTFFNPYIQCIEDLTLADQHFQGSVSTDDLQSSVNLENIQIRTMGNLASIHLNVYDRLKSIDFNENSELKQVRLRLMSDYTYLRRLTLSHTGLTNFSVDFSQTKQTYLHIDVIDLSNGHLETLDFLHYLTFYSLDVSYNRLKIIDITPIHFRRGIYESLRMDFFNLSFNPLESIRINWNNESPHTIDLSNNNLQSIELHGQSTYTLLLGNNDNLSLVPNAFNVDLPVLQYLDLNSIQLTSLEQLIYLHNLTNIRTLILDNNELDREHRTLNWNIFYPWHRNLTHLSMRNMSLEVIESGIDLSDYYHLLTVNFQNNNQLKCDCIFHPFIVWLQTAPPPLNDFYEPLHKDLSLDCPVSLMDMKCDNGKSKLILFLVIFLVGTLLILLFAGFKVLQCYLKRKHSKSYSRIFTDSDLIALSETNAIEKLNDDE